jgi:hypothetical protein
MNYDKIYYFSSTWSQELDLKLQIPAPALAKILALVAPTPALQHYGHRNGYGHVHVLGQGMDIKINHIIFSKSHYGLYAIGHITYSEPFLVREVMVRRGSARDVLFFKLSLA